jgi:hypothetical protein
MSELLRFQHRENQIAQQADTDEQADDGINTHLVTSLHQSVAGGHVADAHDKEQNRHSHEHDIEHKAPR